MRLLAVFLVAVTLVSGPIARVRAAEPGAIDTDPCREDNLVAIQQRFGYVDVAGEPAMSTRVACRRLPDAPATAALAVLHFAQGFEPGDSLDGTFDLHLMIVDGDGDVLAQLREAGAATSDAVRLEEVAIDTGRYHLAPGVRAIGVAWTNSSHCYQCVYWETTFGLFVRDGERLRRVLAGTPSAGSRPAGEEEASCVAAALTDESTFSIGRARHQGYADLIETTVTTHYAGMDPQTNEDCPGSWPEERSRQRWIYDGSTYVKAPAR